MHSESIYHHDERAGGAQSKVGCTKRAGEIGGNSTTSWGAATREERRQRNSKPALERNSARRER